MSTSLHLTDGEISLDDLGSGAPLLLLHGFPTSRHLWDQVAPALADSGYRVVVPDLIGYGASTAPADVRIDMSSQARWMWELLDVLGIEQVALVAHDVGSAAAQLMVAASPARVRKLVILDGVYAGEWAMEAVQSIRAWAPADAHRLPAVLARRLGKSELLRRILAEYAGESGGLRLIRAARDLDPTQTAQMGPALRRSGVPARVLWGRDDHYLPVDSVARPLAELLGAQLVLLPGGHFTPADCPIEVVAALCDFIATPVPTIEPD